jgi:enterochelin esterase-like enzyme
MDAKRVPHTSNGMFVFLFPVLLLCFSFLAQSQPIQPIQPNSAYPGGQVIESIKFKSSIMNQDVEYCVYLPPDYHYSIRGYPVVYLLHGYTDDETGWIQFGEVNIAADKAIMNREIPPMIIVMPDGGLSFYINNSKGDVKWEDMFVKEFIPHIDKTYRTRAEKRYRGIAGLSMGGYGTLLHSLKHPGLFSACAAFSSAVRSDEEMINMSDEVFNRVYAPVFGNKKGKARITAHFKENNILHLVEKRRLEELKQVRYYIDCGDDDYLATGNALLHIALRKKQVPHEYRVRDGAHNWTYWRTGIIDGLKFIGESFHQK